MMTDCNRRQLLGGLAASAVVAGVAACAGLPSNGNARPSGQGSVAGLIVPKMDRVRIGLIGVGARGQGTAKLLSNIAGAQIIAVCDIDPDALNKTSKIMADNGAGPVDTYGDHDHSYRDVLTRADLDMVVISTPWRWHALMAVDSMEAGKQTFVEVPAALTVEDCWQLVNTAERTQKNCMMLENVCYGRAELMVLHMVRQGLLGELLHGEAAYIHDLRFQMKQLTRGTGSWRTAWHTSRNANLYPTHGLGPIAQYMSINRGDRFDYLHSMGSPALGRAAYAKREFPLQHSRNKARYIAGDINTSLIKTRLGRTIMVQYDTTTPRPYSRHNLIGGVNGVFAGFPDRIALEQGGRKSYHEWDYDMDYWHQRYEHPLWQRMAEEAVRQGGHGGMDFLMFWRIIDCLRNGKPLDQDVYDAAAWSVVTALSGDSIQDRGNSQDFPDFTRGDWEHVPPLGIVT